MIVGIVTAVLGESRSFDNLVIENPADGAVGAFQLNPLMIPLQPILLPFSRI
jgi:hypothetical protein